MAQEIKQGMMSDTGANVYLAGLLVFANIDVSGLVDYGLKALLGGAVWMLFRLGSDYLSARMKRKRPLRHIPAIRRKRKTSR